MDFGEQLFCSTLLIVTAVVGLSLIFISRWLSSLYFHKTTRLKCLGSSVVLTPAQPTRVYLKAE